MSMQGEEGTVAQRFENSRVQRFHISIARSVDTYIATHSVLRIQPKGLVAIDW